MHANSLHIYSSYIQLFPWSSIQIHQVYQGCTPPNIIHMRHSCIYILRRAPWSFGSLPNTLSHHLAFSLALDWPFGFLPFHLDKAPRMHPFLSWCILYHRKVATQMSLQQGGLGPPMQFSRFSPPILLTEPNTHSQSWFMNLFI